MNNSYCKSVFIFFGICLFGISYSYADKGTFNSYLKLNIIDSIPLRAYNVNRWTLLGEPYVKKTNNDSIAVELVLIHPNNLQWGDEQLVGYLDMPSVKPVAERLFVFYLLKDNSWQIRIASNGQVYIKQLTGDPPITDPAVIPIKTYFKRG